MRWQELFADLEAQALELEQGLGSCGEMAERIRGEVARVTLLDRLRAQVSGQVTVTVCGVGDISGQLQRVGAGWLLVAAESEAIVPLSAVMGVVELPLAAVGAEGVGVVPSRLGLASVLRAVAMDRSTVVVVRQDGTTLTGTPARVGADFVDLALHLLDDVPRRSRITSHVTVPFDSLACVRRRPTGWD